jgi:hypothetical protein
MKDVYRNAAFCIAATAARDGNDGLFYERDPRGVHPLKIDLSWSKDRTDEITLRTPPTGLYLVGCPCFNIDSVIQDAPLNKRGW